MKNKINIKDVAKHCGVSFKTVSNVINNYEHVTDKMRSKVLESIKVLGYSPNQAAINLAKGKNTTRRSIFGRLQIGCILTKEIDKYEDPYYWTIYKGMEKEFEKLGHVLVFTYSFNQLKNNPVYLNHLLNNQHIDGLITFLGYDEKEIFNTFAEIAPMVGFGNTKNFDSILVDKETAVQNAVDYLVELGHSTIGFIGRIKNPDAEHEPRFKGFLLGLEKHNLEKNQSWCDGDFGINAGYNAATRIIAAGDLPTAFFCSSDLTAFGVYKAFKENRIRIPDDISIISYDDILFSEHLSPPLTTMRVDQAELGRIGARTLIERINNPDMPIVKKIISAELVIRMSCKKTR